MSLGKEEDACAVVIWGSRLLVCGGTSHVCCSEELAPTCGCCSLWLGSGCKLCQWLLISAVRSPTHAKGLAAAVKMARALSDSLTFEVTALPFVNQELRHISGQQQHCVGPVQ